MDIARELKSADSSVESVSRHAKISRFFAIHHRVDLRLFAFVEDMHDAISDCVKAEAVAWAVVENFLQRREPRFL
jgi:hypothetical protein